MVPGGNVVAKATLPQLISAVVEPLGLDMLSSCVKASKIKSILSTAVVESNYVTAETMGQTLGLEQLHHHKIKSDKKHHKDNKEKGDKKTPKEKKEKKSKGK